MQCYSKMFLLFKFVCGTPPSVVGSCVAYSILASAPVPFGFRSYWDLVGARALGTGLDNFYWFCPSVGFNLNVFYWKIKIVKMLQFETILSIMKWLRIFSDFGDLQSRAIYSSVPG